MKAILKFDLPEESHEHEAAMRGQSLAFVIWELDQWLRNEAKYGARNELPTDEVREKLREVMAQHGLTFESPLWV